ncbi:MAG: NAD(P)-binding domain-containing protein [Anaplasmataceae bacterium]|nr:NAD(P)-binding domain-containing protein [Candidatus Heimdallarchaeota archaeon]MDH5796305.1 NAD(P)-binding domain-containing protein [Anaplasmataceae bacterium]
MKKLLIGLGKMGNCIARGWIDAGINDLCIMVKPGQIDVIANEFPQIKVISSISEIDFNPDIIFLAVKPHSIEDILKECAIFTNAIFVSFAVGIGVDCTRKILGANSKVIRIMPNVSCMIGSGVMGGYAVGIDESIKIEISKLFESLGSLHWLENENLIEASAAFSGGLPAFIAYSANKFVRTFLDIGLKEKDVVFIVKNMITEVIEFFSKNDEISIDENINKYNNIFILLYYRWYLDGISIGFQSKVAYKMLLETLRGTSSMLNNYLFNDIIRMVASKGGTTEAGLNAMANSPILAAHQRSLQLFRILQT